MTNPDHLEAQHRLPLILSKLEGEMKRSSPSSSPTSTNTSSDSSSISPDVVDVEQQTPHPPTIFCLQEIDYTFTSALHTFFANRGYAFVTGLYGKKFNGYMGIGIAYPLKEFETIQVDICRLSDEKEGGWPSLVLEDESSDADNNGWALRKVSRGVVGRVKNLALRTVQATTGMIQSYLVQPLGIHLPLLSSSKETIDPWVMSENRFNILLTVALRFRDASSSNSSSSSGSASDTTNVFSLSNYHMPCAFYCPPVMNLHIDMAARRARQLAVKLWKDIHPNNDDDDDNTNGDKMAVPHILAGDFNILPDSAHYRLITTGLLDESDPTYPPMKYGVEWKPTCHPMDSAYAKNNGIEPSFTNYAHLKEEEEAFIGTLDYIFLSRNEEEDGSSSSSSKGKEWVVCDTVKLPEREESGGPFPNECEPSDHLLIAADLELRG